MDALFLGNEISDLRQTDIGGRCLAMIYQTLLQKQHSLPVSASVLSVTFSQIHFHNRTGFSRKSLFAKFVPSFFPSHSGINIYISRTKLKLN